MNTQVDAGNNLTLTSGANTALVGAVAKGNQISADVGGDLLIKSLQDTSTYSSSNKSGGIGAGVSFSNAGVGVSVSGNLSLNNSNSNYASVQEQTGLAAGSGGYQVRVTGNTDLKGGVISSTASADSNSLTTGTLTLRASTYAGRPFGAEDYVQEIGVRFGRHWTRERPRKDEDPKANKAETPEQNAQFSLF